MPSVQVAGVVHAPADERALLARLRGGDEGAFLSLVQRYHASMVRCAQLFVSSRAVAEEVVQESWLAILEGLAGFEGRASLRSWMFAIVANRSRSRAAREARAVPFSSLVPEGDEPAVDGARFLPEDHPRWPGHWAAYPEPWSDERVMLRETVERIGQAIDGLPPAQREVIRLRDVEGWSPEEVCEALSITDGNQRVLLHRARSKVRALLEPYLGGQLR
jgi:RNA polymerase sigma-70 factor (ECF subfamily)